MVITYEDHNMSNPRCALCNVEITGENDSQEHIILNAIGGIRKVPQVFCVSCNSGAGAKWDAEAARQLQFLAVHIGVVRDRGIGRAVEVVTASGRRIRKQPDGRLSFPASKPSITPKGQGVEIRIQATTRAEAEKTLRGLKRKYPKLDVDAALAGVDERDTYLSEPVMAELNFGGTLSGRSVVKSALTLAVSEGVDAHICDLALRYLQNENSDPPFGYYYRRDLVTNRPPNRIFHCVAVKGDPVTRKLNGYIELFSIYRMVIGLSDRYAGPAIAASYSIDPTLGEELNLNVDLTFTDDELRFAIANEEDYSPKLLEACDTVMGIAQQLSFEQELQRASARAYKGAIAALGLIRGQQMTKEIALALSQEITKRMIPFLNHHIVPQRHRNS